MIFSALDLNNVLLSTIGDIFSLGSIIFKKVPWGMDSGKMGNLSLYVRLGKYATFLGQTVLSY